MSLKHSEMHEIQPFTPTKRASSPMQRNQSQQSTRPGGGEQQQNTDSRKLADQHRRVHFSFAKQTHITAQTPACRDWLTTRLDPGRPKRLLLPRLGSPIHQI